MPVASSYHALSRPHRLHPVGAWPLVLCVALLVACTQDGRTVSVLEPETAADALLPNAAGSSTAGTGNTNTAGTSSGAVPFLNTPANSPPPSGAGGAPPANSPPPSGAGGAPPIAAMMPPPAVLGAEQRTLELSAVGSSRFGRVRSTPAGLDCSAPPCRATFAVGTSVTLTAYTEPALGEGFAGWSGACTGLDDCTVTVTEDLFVSASYTPANRVFVTSTLSDGNLGGIASADAQCAQLARQAGLDGEVRAWLSTSSVNAIDRLQGSRGWVRMDGKPFVDTLSELQRGNIYHPLRIDERGGDVGTGTSAHTATGYEGTFTAEACEDWTSNGFILGSYGDPNWTGRGFGFAGSGLCSELRHLYCFEVGKTVRVAPAPVAGRVAFIGTVALDAGLANADAQCQAQASTLGLPGATFKALLASVGASPASRFDLSGLPWVRLDGVPIAGTAAAFFQSERWDSPPNLQPGGFVGDHTIMAGGTSLLEPGTSENTCANWTSIADTPTTQGRSQRSDPFGYFYGYEFSSLTTCAQRVYGVLCMQE